MKHLFKRAAAACAPLLLTASPGGVQAQPGVVSKVNPEPRADEAPASSYWTPEKFKSAKPVPMPVVKPRAGIESKDAPGTKPCDGPEGSDAHAPSKEPVPAVEQLHEPVPDEKLGRNAIPQPRDK